MTFFRRLSIASTLATFLLISLGGFVRATKSGLGCGTDWPDCLGRLTPSLRDRAMLTEYSHRAAAGVVLLLLAALALVALRRHRGRPAILWPALGALALGLAQAGLGAVVVKLELEAESVVLHLGAALALLALLVYLTGASFAAEARLADPNDRSVAHQAMLAGAAVLVLLLVGSYLTGVGEAQDAGFPSWPLIDGRLVPDLSVQIKALHWLHRALAALVGVVLALVSLRSIGRRHELPLASRLARAAGALFFLNILVGAANVWTQGNPAVNSASTTAHLAIGAAVWGTLVAIAVVAHPAVRQGERVVLRRAEPALQGGAR